MPRKSASRNALGAIGGAIAGRIRATLGHPPAIDPHDTRRQCVPNGLDGPGVGLGRRDAKQGRVATANDGREPGSRINPRETVLLFWSRWFALPSQLLDFAHFPQPTKRARHCHPIGSVSLRPRRPGLPASGHCCLKHRFWRAVPRRQTRFYGARGPGRLLGRPEGVRRARKPLSRGLPLYLTSRTCGHTGRSRWSRCLAAQLLDIPVRRPPVCRVARSEACAPGPTPCPSARTGRHVCPVGFGGANG
jgi:hypothetical protein